jgi:short-subunit dehydrogenase
MQIRGKTVLITGASSGIGAACAREFQRRGANLVLVARSANQLRDAASPGDLVLPGDLVDPGFRKDSIAAAVARFGGIDVLVNNAGVGLYQPAWRASAAELRHMFELNFFAPLDLIQLAAPHMRAAGRGVIVNVSSIAGRVTLPWFTLYSATKAALGALTRGLRSELKRDGIHCVEVCPGYVRTAFQRNVLSGSPPEALVAGRRFATSAENCANAIVRAVERESRTVITPVSGRLLLAAQALFPALVEAQLARMMHRQEARP